MRRAASGWLLPAVRVPRRVWVSQMESLDDVIAAELGVQSGFLRCAWTRADETGSSVEAVLVFDRATEDWVTPATVRGSTGKRSPILTLSLPDHRPILENFLAELNGAEIPPQRPDLGRALAGWLRRPVGSKRNWSAG